MIWGRQSLCRCMWCQSFDDKHVAKISSSPVAYKGYFLEDFSTSFTQSFTEIPKTALATSEIKPDSPMKAPHPAPTSVRNVASYSRIRRVSKSIKPPSTSGNKTYQPPLDSGLATLTPDVRPVNQGCSIHPSIAQIMAINTSSNNP